MGHFQVNVKPDQVLMQGYQDQQKVIIHRHRADVSILKRRLLSLGLL